MFGEKKNCDTSKMLILFLYIICVKLSILFVFDKQINKYNV